MGIEIFDPTRCEGTMVSGWIHELEASDSRNHKEKVIEKALMAARLGSIRPGQNASGRYRDIQALCSRGL